MPTIALLEKDQLRGWPVPLERLHLIVDAMSEATQNLSGDFAVKLSCTSLLLEAWILEPKIISPPSVKP